jgi:uncharacterized membrane protein YccC
MNFSISLKRFIYGQHFLSGLFAACGVISFGLLWYAVTDPPTAMVLSSGALCVSLVDMPASLRYKRVDFLAAAIGGAAVTLLVAVALPSAPMLGGAVLLTGFVAAMLTAFGKRAMPLSFSLLLAMVLTLGSADEWHGGAARYALLFVAGGGAYALYGTLIAWLSRLRIKRQALADALFELAEFARCSAAFFSAEEALEACYRALVAQQAVVAEKQQTARDLVFEGYKTSAEQRLVGILRDTIDVYEYILSTQTDHELLRCHYADSDVMPLLRDLMEKCADDLELVAYAILRDRRPARRVRYMAELFALAHEIDRSPHLAAASGAPRHALEALKGTVYKMRHTTAHIGRLHDTVDAEAPAEASLAHLDPAAFISPSSYTLTGLREQLKPDAPALRHAVRTTLALACGVALAQWLPFSTHGYWILLTIVVIMRSNFSAMRQRYGDRLMGNLVGCIGAALVLYLDPQPWVIVVLLFACVTIAHTFVTINYRYTSIAACLMALLYLNFIDPGDFAVAERLIDTAIGATLAYGLSFLLPSWEHVHIPHKVHILLQNLADYAGLVLMPTRDERHYRLKRRNLFSAIAALSAALQAMLREPRGARRGVESLQRLIADSYLLAAQLAAVRLILNERRSDLDLDAASALLADVHTSTRDRLNEALALTGYGPCKLAGPTVSVSFPDNGGPAADWNMTTLLQRRLALMSGALDQVLDDARRLGATGGQSPAVQVRC